MDGGDYGNTLNSGGT